MFHLDVHRTIPFAIKSMSNQIKRYIDYHAAKNNETTGMQNGIIHFIGSSAKDVYQKDIEEEFNVRRSTATGLLQLMEKNGLIEKTQVAHDARLKKISLTEKSEAIHRDAQATFEQVEKELTEGISQEELDVFFDVLDKVSSNISKTIQ